MTQEFHISVTPVGQNDYLVRTEQVAPGVPLAEELVRWPVADWLAAAGSLMNDPLQSVLQGDAMALSACLEETNARNSVNLVALGQQLYNALFKALSGIVGLPPKVLPKITNKYCVCVWV